jgi:hypothetical protein
MIEQMPRVHAKQPIFSVYTLVPETAFAPERENPLDDGFDTQSGGVE